jgi:hypothetical protein
MRFLEGKISVGIQQRPPRLCFLEPTSALSVDFSSHRSKNMGKLYFGFFNRLCG